LVESFIVLVLTSEFSAQKACTAPGPVC